MEITTSDRIPDYTYFRVGDVAPRRKNSGLEVLNGQGTRRSSWGSPGVTSTVVINEDDFAAIHTGFYHKHGGGQFWRYYIVEDNKIQRLMWRSLTEERRLQVLDGFVARAPGWAREPGKLRRDRGKVNSVLYGEAEALPDGSMIGYKWLLDSPEGLRSPTWWRRSLWDNDRLEANQVPTKDNNYGVYSAKSPSSPILQRYIAPGRVLVKLALSGVVVEHDTGYRSQYAEVLETLERR